MEFSRKKIIPGFEPTTLQLNIFWLYTFWDSYILAKSTTDKLCLKLIATDILQPNPANLNLLRCIKIQLSGSPYGSLTNLSYKTWFFSERPMLNRSPVFPEVCALNIHNWLRIPNLCLYLKRKLGLVKMSTFTLVSAASRIRRVL